MLKLIGNHATIEILNNRISTNRLPNLLLFTGPVGTGKSELAKQIARELGLETIVYNMAEKEKASIYIEEIFKYKRKTCFILEEFDGLENLQLRFLEYINTLNSDITLIATTSQPKKVIEGILSRFRKFSLGPLDQEETGLLIESICGRQEDKQTVRLIYRYTAGIPRDIINLVNLELDDRELKLFINFVENNEILEFFKKTENFTSFIEFLRNHKLNKNFIWAMKDFVIDALAFREGVKGSDNSLSLEEKRFVTNFFKTVNAIDLMEAVSKVKEGDSYSFISIFKLFNKVDTASQELTKSESFTTKQKDDRSDVESDLMTEKDLLDTYGKVFKKC